MWLAVVLSIATTVGVVCSIRLTSDNYTTTKPNTTRLNHRQLLTHRGLNLEYQTDGQMATKPNTTRLKLHVGQSQTHKGLNMEYKTDG